MYSITTRMSRLPFTQPLDLHRDCSHHIRHPILFYLEKVQYGKQIATYYWIFAALSCYLYVSFMEFLAVILYAYKESNSSKFRISSQLVRFQAIFDQQKKSPIFLLEEK